MPLVEFRPQADLVDALVRSQCPALAAAPARLAALGWDNAVFRVGARFAARLPVRRLAAPLIQHEFRWVAQVSAPLARLGLSAPTPLFLGQPELGYPWPWLVCEWVPGEPVATLPVARRDHVAEDLAGALVALHRPAAPDAPANAYRGVPLAARVAVMAHRRRDVQEQLGRADTVALYNVWERGLAAAPWQRAPCWLHGDPHPYNLVHRDGRLSGLIDFGDLTAGDPASDLCTAWLTFTTRQRSRLRSIADASGRYDAALWQRAAAWAVVLVTALIADESARELFAPVIAHALAELTGG